MSCQRVMGKAEMKSLKTEVKVSDTAICYKVEEIILVSVKFGKIEMMKAYDLHITMFSI